MVAAPAVKFGRIYWLFGRWRQVAPRDLFVVAVPKGSTLMLTLSDVQNPRTPDTDIGAATNGPLEARMRPQQLGEARRP
jgi:hypothetical protein